jgi:hypothetical protein
MEKTKLIKMRKLAIAIGFFLVICGVAMRPALADEHHGHGGEHHEGRHDRGYHGGGGYVYAPEPDQYYYTPQPDYYAPPPPSQGINLFFGIN